MIMENTLGSCRIMYALELFFEKIKRTENIHVVSYNLILECFYTQSNKVIVKEEQFLRWNMSLSLFHLPASFIFSKT